MSIANDPNRMLSTEEAAAFMGLQPCTLAAWREDGSQPDLPFFKIGKAVRYRCADVLAFIEARRAVSTLAARQIKPAIRPIKADEDRQTPTAAETAGPKRKKAAPAESGANGANSQQSLF
jgi:hypothetical protein